MRPEQIKQFIEAGLTDCTAIIQGDDGQHFSATVLSPVFAGKSRIQKQQLVYAILQNYINDGSIHAISIKTFTPEEWQLHNTSA